jgi:hypothetical protein
MENPARGPGGIPLFFTYHQEKKSIKGQQYTFTIKGNFDLLEKRKRKKKSTLFHSQVLGSRDHISE